MDDPEVINFLLSTEIIPLCLRIMETGSELSKTVRVCDSAWSLLS
jgi:CCR4-NOT transcription complex subunit 9